MSLHITLTKLFIYLAFAVGIPSMALYVVEIVTIILYKEYHNSFFILFVIRAISDLIFVGNSYLFYRLPAIIGFLLFPVYTLFPNWLFTLSNFFTAHAFQANNLTTICVLLNRLTAITMPLKHERLWKKFLPLIALIVNIVPIISCWPIMRMDAQLLNLDPNFTDAGAFSIYEPDADAPYTNYGILLNVIVSLVFLPACIAINLTTIFAFKLHNKKRNLSQQNDENARIERKLCIYAFVTFLGHALFSCILITTKLYINNLEVASALGNLFPLIIDTSTVVFSSWLLLWASGSIRGRIFKNFGIASLLSSSTTNHQPAPIRPSVVGAANTLMTTTAEADQRRHSNGVISTMGGGGGGGGGGAARRGTTIMINQLIK